jgi:hypothetical protein
MSAHLENTALILKVARRRSRGKSRDRAVGLSLKHLSDAFFRRATIAMFLGVTLLYIGTFGWLSGVPWATVVVLIMKVPSVMEL